MTVVMAEEYQKQGKRESELLKPHDNRLRGSEPVWEHAVL